MKDCIGIDFDNVILKCYNKDRPKRFIPYVDKEEEWIEAIWKLLPDYAIFLYSKKNPKVVENWFHKEIANGGYPFKVEVIPENKKLWYKTLVVGITDKKLPAIAYIGDTIKFTNWKKVLEEVSKLE